ncbi:MAG: hypothetical protein JKY96_05810 [Phycisphaerales bacterium]|nr:hypothetical protein [Phycisphaerales bacterium]
MGNTGHTAYSLILVSLRSVGQNARFVSVSLPLHGILLHFPTNDALSKQLDSWMTLARFEQERAKTTWGFVHNQPSWDLEKSINEIDARSLYTESQSCRLGADRPMGGNNKTTEQRGDLTGITPPLQTQMLGCIGSDAGWVPRKKPAPNRHRIKRQQVGSSSSPNQPVVAPGGV